jgi:hypothetical protein
MTSLVSSLSSLHLQGAFKEGLACLFQDFFSPRGVKRLMSSEKIHRLPQRQAVESEEGSVYCHDTTLQESDEEVCSSKDESFSSTNLVSSMVEAVREFVCGDLPKEFLVAEKVDVAKLKEIIPHVETYIRSLDEGEEKEKSQKRLSVLKGVRADMDRTGVRQVIFRLHNCGRMTATGASITGMWSEYRKVLTYSYDEDIDIKNCHPVILSQVLSREGIAFPLLNELVAHREELTERAGVDKVRWLKILNGGGISVDDNELVREFKAQRDCAVNELMSLPKCRKLMSYAQKKQTDRNKNVKNSALSVLLCNLERECAVLAMRSLESKNYKISAFIYDGFHVKKLRGSGVSDADLRLAEKYVEQHSAYHLQIELVKKSLTDFNPESVKPSITDTQPSLQPSYSELKERFEHEEGVKFILHERLYMQHALDRRYDQNGLTIRLYTMNAEQLRVKYQHLHYWEPNEDGKLKKYPFIPRWTGDPKKPIFLHSVFVKQYETNDLLATFAGYRASRAPPITEENKEEASEMLSLFQQLVRAVTGCENVGLNDTDKPTYTSTFDGSLWYSAEEEWFTRWMAFIMQKPNALPDADVFMCDPRNGKSGKMGGTGKDTLKLVLFAVIGDNYCVDAKVNQVIGHKFAIDLSCKKLCVFQEGIVSGAENTDEQKVLATSKKRSVERKGENIDEGARHYCCFIQSSNRANGARTVDPGQRRTLVIQPTDVLRRCEGWFARFYGTREEPYRFEEPCVIRAIYDYLMNVNVEGFAFGGDGIPKNAVMKRMISQSLRPCLKFWNFVMDAVPEEWLNANLPNNVIVEKYKRLFPRQTTGVSDDVIKSELLEALTNEGLLCRVKKSSERLTPGCAIKYFKSSGMKWQINFNLLAQSYHEKEYRESPAWSLEGDEEEDCRENPVLDAYSSHAPYEMDLNDDEEDALLETSRSFDIRP